MSKTGRYIGGHTVITPGIRKVVHTPYAVAQDSLKEQRLTRLEKEEESYEERRKLGLTVRVTTKEELAEAAEDKMHRLEKRKHRLQAKADRKKKLLRLQRKSKKKLQHTSI